MKSVPLIALLTDFGNLDPFVGILKGVISQIAPGVPIVDLCNEIPAGDIQRAAITLWQSYAYFPPASVFVCVVDPGVGSSRRGVIVQSGGYTFIGPDNGIFSRVINKDFKAWELSNIKYRLSFPGNTFHGRDIFAPAAGYLAQGVDLEAFGQGIKDLKFLPNPLLFWQDTNRLTGEILYPDHYGNLLTSLGCFGKGFDNQIKFLPWLPEVLESLHSISKFHLELPNGDILPLKETFAEIPAGKCAVIIGSSGLLEIVANRQSAANLLGLPQGTPIIVKFEFRS